VSHWTNDNVVREPREEHSDWIHSSKKNESSSTHYREKSTTANPIGTPSSLRTYDTSTTDQSQTRFFTTVVYEFVVSVFALSRAVIGTYGTHHGRS